MSYGIAKKASRNGAKFGTGALEGVIAPETAAHAAGTSALLPMLALGISGYAWAGLSPVLVGVLAPRLIKKRAPELLLHLATQDKDIYREAIDYEILEVRARVPT